MEADISFFRLFLHKILELCSLNADRMMGQGLNGQEKTK